MGEHVIEVNDSDFEQVVLQSDVPVLVDFLANWYRPCATQAKMITVAVRRVNITDPTVRTVHNGSTGC